MARRKKQYLEPLDYHEGLSSNQVKIVLRELNLSLDKFGKWMYGQTSPLIDRTDRKSGKHVYVPGTYEYDLFRWIRSQRTGIAPIWD